MTTEEPKVINEVAFLSTSGNKNPIYFNEIGMFDTLYGCGTLDIVYAVETIYLAGYRIKSMYMTSKHQLVGWYERNKSVRMTEREAMILTIDLFARALQ